MTRFDDAVGRVLAQAPSPSDVPTLRRRLRRHRIWRATAAVSGAVVMFATVAVVVQQRHHANVVAHVAPTTSVSSRESSTTVASSATSIVSFPRGVPAPVDRSAPEPTTFFASIGAGDERLTVVNVATGAHGPFLTSGSQALVRLSNDHKTIYAPDLVGCGRGWTAIDVTTGRSQPAYTDLPNPSDVVESPDGSKLAYVRQAPSTRGGLPCGYEELVVRDIATKKERVWRAPANTGRVGVTITQLGWSPDSSHLVYDMNGPGIQQGVVPATVAQVLDINEGTAITDGITLAPPDPTCRIEDPRYRPGTELIIAAENCLNRSATLIDYDATNGQVHDQRQVATGQLFGVIDIAVDASGQHIIYILDSAQTDGEVFVLRNQQSVHLINDTYQVMW